MSTDSSISVLNYLGGAVAFGLLAWLLLGPWRKLHYPPTVPIAALATVIRLLTTLAYTYRDFSPTLLLFADIAFYGTWMLAISRLTRVVTGTALPAWLSWVCRSLVAAATAVALATGFTGGGNHIIYAVNSTIWINLVLSIAALVLLEQLFRNINLTSGHALRFFAIGLAGIFAFELYFYSQMLIVEAIPATSWSARGAIYGLLGVFLIVTLSKTGDLPQEVALSRKIVFYSASLTGAGLLLFAMGVIGYYMRHFGGSWGSILQQILTFAAIVAVLVVFTVPRLRGWAQVMINKHFFRHKYDYRNEWLRLIDVLSQPVDEGDLRQRAIRAMADIFGSRGGCLWLQERDHFVPVTAWQLAMPANAAEPTDSGFLQAMHEREWVFEAGNMQFDENRLLPDWATQIRDLWIVCPLLNENDLLGFMALAKPEQQTELTWEDLDLLKTVGRQIASYLARHHAAELLAQSRQFDAYNKLTAFIMHDLKNLIAQQKLVVENAAKHKENPAFVEDAIRTIENSVTRMSNLLGKLQQKEPTPGRTLEFEQILVEAVKKCGDGHPLPALRLEDRGILVRADHDNLVMIFTHLIKNAQDATPQTGFIDVRLSTDGPQALVEVEDNGEGMTNEFIRERLFRPFDTTKSGKGMGIGVYQVREYIRTLGGDVSVHSEPGIGTTFRVAIPFEQARQEQDVRALANEQVN